MSKTPIPQPGEPLFAEEDRQIAAMIEVISVCAIYIVVALWVVRAVDLSTILPAALSAEERSVGSNFLAGGIIQIALVAAIALANPTMRRAVKNLPKLGTIPAWGAALIAAAIHIITLTVFFIDSAALVIEVSFRNFILSSMTALDALSQELLFRGYVIYRLARSGVHPALQIAFSAILFASIHIGYVGEDFSSAISPLVGTAMLGGFLAWSVQLGRGALLPAIFAHLIILIAVQPWLALA